MACLTQVEKRVSSQKYVYMTLGLLLLGIILFFSKIYANGPMEWDEASLFITSVKLHHFLSNGSYSEFTHILNNQKLYPPFFVLESSFLFFLFPILPATIRSLSLVHLIIAGFLVSYLSFHQANNGFRKWSVLSVLLFMTAPVVLDTGTIG